MKKKSKKLLRLKSKTEKNRSKEAHEMLEDDNELSDLALDDDDDDADDKDLDSDN